MPVRVSARARSSALFRLLGLATLLVPLALLAACGDGEASEDGEELREITFMAGFRAQANLPFAAVYVADAQGFFAEEGLQVNIQHSSGQDEHLRLLLEGTAHFVTGTAAQAIRRAEDGLPMRAVALFGQRGDQGFVAHADSGITGPADFAGRSVGFKAGVVPAELHALLGTVGLTVDDVQLVGVGFDPRVFIEGGVDVYPVFLNNEPDTIQRAGVPINIIDPHDFGVPTLGLTFLAHADTVRDDADLVARFLRATIRATHWIDANRDEAIDIVLRHAEGADAEHQRYLLDTDLDAATRADGRWGLSNEDAWQALVELLLHWDVIDSPVDLADAVDTAILERLYADGAFD
jgi:ABC-type nitrate/sulfonate/bicarbonate transport system substrate-binding protein